MLSFPGSGALMSFLLSVTVLALSASFLPRASVPISLFWTAFLSRICLKISSSRPAPEVELVSAADALAGLESFYALISSDFFSYLTVVIFSSFFGSSFFFSGGGFISHPTSLHQKATRKSSIIKNSEIDLISVIYEVSVITPEAVYASWIDFAYWNWPFWDLMLMAWT